MARSVAKETKALSKSFEKRAKSAADMVLEIRTLKALGFAFIQQRAKAGGEAGTGSFFAKANGTQWQGFAGSGT